MRPESSSHGRTIERLFRTRRASRWVDCTRRVLRHTLLHREGSRQVAGLLCPHSNWQIQRGERFDTEDGLLAGAKKKARILGRDPRRLIFHYCLCGTQVLSPAYRLFYCKLPGAKLTGLPMASPDTRSSTLRFCWRPAEVSLEATGKVLPKPLDETDWLDTPSCTR